MTPAPPTPSPGTSQPAKPAEPDPAPPTAPEPAEIPTDAAPSDATDLSNISAVDVVSADAPDRPQIDLPPPTSPLTTDAAAVPSDPSTPTAALDSIVFAEPSAPDNPAPPAPADLPTPTSSHPPAPAASQSTHRLPTLTASQLLHTPLPTHLPLLPSLDAHLSIPGGLPPSQVTEFFGPPGAGKTALALTLAAAALRRNTPVVWISCSSPLHIPRLERFLADTPALRNFRHVYCGTLPQLLATVLGFPNGVLGEEAGLVVVDGVSTLFVGEYPPGMEDASAAGKVVAARRYGVAEALGQGLLRVARGGRAVVVCQGVTTRVVAGVGGVLMPAVGWEGWSRAVGVRLGVWREEGRGVVEVLRSRGREWAEEGNVPEAYFRCVNGGVEEIPPEEVGKGEERESADGAESDETVGVEANGAVGAEANGTVGPETNGAVDGSPTKVIEGTEGRRLSAALLAQAARAEGNGIRKRKWGIEAGVIPDSEGESEDEDEDEEEVFG